MSRIWLVLPLLACSDNELNSIKDPVESVTDERVPCLVVEPEVLALGTESIDLTALGYTTLSGTVTLTNDCGSDEAAELALESVEWVDAMDTLVVSALEQDLLADGESTEVIVTWAPEEDGALLAELAVASDDPADAVVTVTVTGELEVALPSLEVDPWDEDLGEVDIGDTVTTELLVSNAGDGTLIVESLELASASSSEFTLSWTADDPPWAFPGGGTDTIALTVTYTPEDEGEDSAELQFTTNHPDDPTDQAVVTGMGVDPGYLGCWYTLDDGTYTTVGTDSSYPISSHGTTNLYYYEPSGGRGLQVPGDEASDFTSILDFVLAGYTDHGLWSSTASFSTVSSASFGSTAHFTYYLCDWKADASVSSWSLQVTGLDDGMLVLLNEEVVTSALLGGSISTTLDVVPDARNSLVLIHVDDAAVNRTMSGLGLYADGVFFEGME